MKMAGNSADAEGSVIFMMFRLIISALYGTNPVDTIHESVS